MGLAGIAYLFLTIYSLYMGYPSGTEFRALSEAAKAGLSPVPGCSSSTTSS